MKSGQNVFVSFLELLKVKHTGKFSNRYFNEHPHKNNLFGISKMLSDYGVKNAGTRIEDKEKDLFNIECPFIAHIGGFVVVYKVENPSPALPQGEGGVVHYIWNGKKINITVEQFLKSWSGVILLAETTPNSLEPDYKEHRKKELFHIAQQAILIVAGVLIFGLTYFHNSIYSNLGITLLLIVNLIGAYIGYLLVLKQMHIHSQYADKICSLFSQSDCNNDRHADGSPSGRAFAQSHQTPVSRARKHTSFLSNACGVKIPPRLQNETRFRRRVFRASGPMSLSSSGRWRRG